MFNLQENQAAILIDTDRQTVEIHRHVDFGSCDLVELGRAETIAALLLYKFEPFVKELMAIDDDDMKSKYQTETLKALGGK